jgi:hypothetical protein
MDNGVTITNQPKIPEVKSTERKVIIFVGVSVLMICCIVFKEVNVGSRPTIEAPKLIKGIIKTNFKGSIR